MCGIIGGICTIDSEKFNSNIAIKYLKYMYRRGQDGSGMAGYDDKSYIQHKKFAPPNELRVKSSLNMFVGGTRYGTSGSAVDKESSNVDRGLPIYAVNTKYGLLVGAHNGNVLVDMDGYESDSEVLIHKLAEYIDNQNRFFGKKRNVKKAVSQLMKEIPGSYSVVAMLGDDTLLAFRDPHGVRPLVWGRNNGNYLLSSESMGIDEFNYEYMGSVPRGSLMIFERNSEQPILEEILVSEKKECYFELTYFTDERSRVNGTSIREVRKELGKKLVDIVSKKIDLKTIDRVIPVPKTSIPIAKEFGKESGIPYSESINKNQNYRTYIAPTHEERHEMIKNKYSVNENLSKENIIIVDDSIVRGSTGVHLSKILRDAGAEKIILASASGKKINACYLGINMKGNLIGKDRTDKEVAEKMGFDEIIYMDRESLGKVLGEEICDYCITGNHINPQTAQIIEKLEVLNRA